MLTIERLGQGGDGVAEGPIFVPRSLPGETVTGDVVGNRVPDPKVITPSTDRVSPPCPHFKRCGGCALQHASDAFVADWKVAQVQTALSRAGLTATIAGIKTSPPQSRRRAALSGRKTKKGAQVGFHVRAGADIVAIPDCTLLHPDLMAVLPVLEQVTRLAAPRGAEIGLHVTVTETGLDLVISDAKPWDRDLLAGLAPLAGHFARITWNGELALQQTAPLIDLGPGRVTPPPGAFLQATAHGQTVLADAVTRALAGVETVVDLFAGTGTFTFPVARSARVHAVEGARDLIDALDDGLRHASGLRPITTEVRDLFRNPLLPDELARFDSAVIDPPRAGAEAQVAQLVKSDLRRIAFVSCNPVTFARDAATLVAAGWTMGPITVVDQFRWSTHVELVTTFEKP